MTVDHRASAGAGSTPARHTEETKRCSRCKQDKPVGLFWRRKTRGSTLYAECKQCTNVRTAEGARRSRATGADTARWILTDARKWDRRHGYVCDLSREDVAALIQGGCTYCGERELRVSLDRRDNTQGHTCANVVAACVRCNYLRRDMPFEAWMNLVPSIRETRERGLFGAWVGGVHHGRTR